ncbi:hypothetical protein [Phytomonospora endophytica]|uniref:Uncharacterized protein n=1 Tax=Phytomonospora endophytica TaxID=714109 RepID=A0A841FVJ9_9ACTN|nr:hypothetical protein [Phytomonospora endophytica]MBB6037758.1 hypothetical protein [Phytomonospora endophytica]
MRVASNGSIDQIDDEPLVAGDVVTVWTRCEEDENPFALVQIRGLLHGHRGLVWLPEDAEVEIVDLPRYAGRPEDLVKQAKPVRAPAGSKGVLKTAEGWPELIWRSDIVYSPVQGWDDAEIAVEVLLCALAVAPDDDPSLKPMLLAALAARYAALQRDPQTYPTTRYPWRNRAAPGSDMLEYLHG